MAWNDDDIWAGPEPAAAPGHSRPGCWWLLACLPLAWWAGGELVLLTLRYPSPCIPTDQPTQGDAFLLLFRLLITVPAFALTVLAGRLAASHGRSRWRFLLWALIVVMAHKLLRIWLQDPAAFC
ncbi:hypothetical protein [Kitasatospora griseola]|uniref:hypothetical protein n=1 Tax=Kitasatospora griseola TaxID=2064 RepID=UPI00343B75FF